MFSLEFINKIKADFNELTASNWVSGRLADTRSLFQAQMTRGSGVSRPNTYPINKSGDLSAGTRNNMTGALSGEIGTNVFYGKFLDKGTYKMKPRKMYKAALNETMAKAPRLNDLARSVEIIPS